AVVSAAWALAEDHGDGPTPALRTAGAADRGVAGVDRGDLPALRLRRLLVEIQLLHRSPADQLCALAARITRHVARSESGRVAVAAADLSRVLGSAERAPAPCPGDLGRAGAWHAAGVRRERRWP